MWRRVVETMGLDQMSPVWKLSGKMAIGGRLERFDLPEIWRIQEPRPGSGDPRQQTAQTPVGTIKER
jgi:hypothetical protein